MAELSPAAQAVLRAAGDSEPGIYETIIATLEALVTLVGATVTVEGRYAKVADVESRLNQLYAKQLKTRILELQLKPSPLSPADRAMLLHLQQELKEATE